MNLAAALAPRPAFRPRARLDVAPRASPSSAAPSTEPTFAQDVLLGLALGQKAVPSRWLHDARGKQLRGEIALLESHYPARNEALVLGRCAAQIAELAGRDARLIELGSSAGPEAASLDGGSTGRRRVLYIPGATLGGFATEEAVGLLTRIGRQAGRDALLVVGTDTTHDPAVLIAIRPKQRWPAGSANFWPI